MSNDPAANMASLAALCDDLCETESATVDRRQLCEWLSAMQAQADDIERLTQERDEARERAGELRMCLNCGKMRAASEPKEDMAECQHPDYPGLAGCTWQATPQEAWEHWRKVAHDERIRANAAEAERDALRDALRSIEGMVANATGAPMTADRWLDRIEERARAALGGQP